MASVGIIGAGIAGLTAAYRLQKQGLEVMVFEARDRPGGMIRSEHISTNEGTYLVEHGPNALQATTPLLSELIGALGLGEQRIQARPGAQQRYVAFGNRLVCLPTSLTGLLTTELFSPRAKLRLLAEPFISAAPEDAQESVAEFARRRLGPELLDYGLNPFVAGVFAGDPEELALRHALPRLHRMEQQHGSIVGGALLSSLKKFSGRLLSRRQTASTDRGLFSFRKGLQELPNALADHLDDRICLNTPAVAVRPHDHQWTVTVERDDRREEITFDATLLTLPSHRLQGMDLDVTGSLSPLFDVHYPPLSLLATGFSRTAVEHPLDGFGMLIPEVESEYRTLGTLFSSSIFDRRAPDGHVLLTSFVGGTRHPDLARASDSALYEAVAHDLRRLLGAHDPPVFTHRVRWDHAIPQYNLGYERIKTLVSTVEESNAGLFLAGNYRQGISVGDAARSGDQVARRIAESISG